MPHSKLKNRPIYLDSVVLNCFCGQTFNFASERDLNTKLQLHRKVCSKLPGGSKEISIPKKAMQLKEGQCNEAERVKRVDEHH